MRITNISYIIEYVSTFFFVLVIFASGGNPLVIAAALGLAIFLDGKISGSMFNPAVSFAMFMDGALKPTELVMYIVAQLLGGASAYYAYKMVKA